MFRASVPAQTLKEGIDCLRALVTEAIFELKPDGVSVVAVDPAHVGAVRVDLNSSAFEGYKASEGKIGIDLTKLIGIVESAPKDCSVELEVDEDTHKMVIKAAGLTYNMSLINPESMDKKQEMPALTYPGCVTLACEDLRVGIKAADKVGDYIFIGMKYGIFFIEGMGDLDSVRFEPEIDKEGLYRAVEMISMFAIEYLLDVSKAISRLPRAVIEFGKDFPVKIAADIAEGNGNVTYVLAPRVEND